MALLIPITNDPDRRVTVGLGDNLLTLRTYYNPTVPGWYLDIDGRAQGLALVPGVNVLEASPQLTATLGQFRVIPTNGADVIATPEAASTVDPLAGVRVFRQQDEPSAAAPGDYWVRGPAVNVLRWSEDISKAPWSPVFAAVNSATQVTLSATSGARVDQVAPVPAVAGDTWTYSADLRGAGTVRMAVNTSTGVGGSSPEKQRTLTGEWVRYSETVTFVAGATGSVRAHGVIRRGGDTATVVEMRNAQINRGGPLPYVASGASMGVSPGTYVKTESGSWAAATLPAVAAPEPRAVLGESALLWWFAPGEWPEDDTSPATDPLPADVREGYRVA